MIEGKNKSEKFTDLEIRNKSRSILPPLCGLVWDFWKPLKGTTTAEEIPAYVEGYIKNGRFGAFCHRCKSNACMHVYIHLLSFIRDTKRQIAQKAVGITLDDVFNGKVPKEEYGKVTEYAKGVTWDQIKEYLLSQGIDPFHFEKYLKRVRNHNLKTIQKYLKNSPILEDDPFSN